MKKTDAEHLTEFKKDGYTLFEKVYNAETMQRWREKFLQMQVEGIVDNPSGWWFGNMVERAPTLMLPSVTQPLIWDFAEAVLGPFVQLDNLTLAGFPSVSKEDAQGKASGWHRDRWAQIPAEGAYFRPHAINAICYLQDLTPEFGPLRVIPGSHRRLLTLAPDEKTRPHPEEKLLSLSAGDVVVIHNCLLHSGTPNTSGQTRFFYSVFYNLTWLKTTDNHQGPNVQRIIRDAWQRHDYRTLRLFGVDDQLEKRANCGFIQPDETLWEEWATADKAAQG